MSRSVTDRRQAYALIQTLIGVVAFCIWVVLGIWVSAFLDQQPGEGRMVLFGSPMQRRLLPVVLGVWVCACGQGCLRVALLAASCGLKEFFSGGFLYRH